MDYSMVIRCLACILVTSVFLAECSVEPSEWVKRSVKAASREERSHRHNAANTLDAGSPIADGSLSSAGKRGNMKSDNCCLNGGTCIMNSFCHCKKNYYGRYCEHRVRHKSCNTIRHGTWMASGCHLCHCFDGQMRCKVTTIPGCENLSYIEGVEKDPDYLVGIDQKNADYETFYDGYEDSATDAAANASTGSPVMTSLLTYVAVAIVAGLVS